MIKVKKRKILLLPGDGIGPEVITEVKKVINWLNKNRSLDFEVDEDGIYSSQKEYFKTPKGRRALKRARQKYDKENPDKRRKQKRDYMRRKRDKDPDAWRD